MYLVWNMLRALVAWSELETKLDQIIFNSLGSEPLRSQASETFRSCWFDPCEILFCPPAFGNGSIWFSIRIAIKTNYKS